MKLRTVLKEFEAHLKPAQPGSRIEGKSEWKHYGDGTHRFKISIRNIPLPDDSRIDVILEETHIAAIIVQNNKAKIDTEDNLSIRMPNVRAGRRLQIKSEDTVLAEGQYLEE
jgi:hypothetical protein